MDSKVENGFVDVRSGVDLTLDDRVDVIFAEINEVESDGDQICEKEVTNVIAHNLFDKMLVKQDLAYFTNDTGALAKEEVYGCGGGNTNPDLESTGDVDFNRKCGVRPSTLILDEVKDHKFPTTPRGVMEEKSTNFVYVQPLLARFHSLVAMNGCPMVILMDFEGEHVNDANMKLCVVSGGRNEVVCHNMIISSPLETLALVFDPGGIGEFFGSMIEVICLLYIVIACGNPKVLLMIFPLFGTTRKGHMIEGKDIGLVTSNPVIFHISTPSSGIYNDRFRLLIESGKDIEFAHWDLTIMDVQDAYRPFESICYQGDAGGGYVSVEVPPKLADDMQGTFEAAIWLHKVVYTGSVYIRVFAAVPCIPPIKERIVTVISFDVTSAFFLPSFLAGTADVAYFSSSDITLHGVSCLIDIVLFSLMLPLLLTLTYSALNLDMLLVFIVYARCLSLALGEMDSCRENACEKPKDTELSFHNRGLQCRDITVIASFRLRKMINDALPSIQVASQRLQKKMMMPMGSDNFDAHVGELVFRSNKEYG